MLRYPRVLPATVSPQVYEATAAHIRNHLSSIASPVDDPTEFAALVQLTRNDLGDGRIELVGTLERAPVADYLRPGFDPDHEAAANPLSVPSIEDQP